MTREGLWVPVELVPAEAGTQIRKSNSPPFFHPRESRGRELIPFLFDSCLRRNRLDICMGSE